jgi:NAD(P)H-hydrate epimerase
MSAVALTRAQSREVDRLAIEKYGISGLVLMENAGRGCVDVLEKIGIKGHVFVLCGTGNNGGDGFVIARHLAIRGHDARVMVLSDKMELQLRGDAEVNYRLLKGDVERSCHTPPDNEPRPTPDFLPGMLDFHADGATWIVDALLGTGAQGDPRPLFAGAIDWMNARHRKTKLLAVDVPSGLDCDTGQPSSHTVRADHTCTFAAMKVGFTQKSAKPYLGKVHVCDIGVSPRLIREVLQ